MIGEGVYRIINKKTGTVLDLNNGSSDDGTYVYGYKKNTNLLNQMWHIQATDTGYTIKNLMAQTFLSVQAYKPKDGTFLVGYANPKAEYYTWQIEEHDNDVYTIFMKSDSLKFNIDLNNDSDKDGTSLSVYSEKNQTLNAQIFYFENVLLEKDLIKTLFQRKFGEYISLIPDMVYRSVTLEEVNTINKNQNKQIKYKKEIFDCEDFAIGLRYFAALEAYKCNESHPYAIFIVGVDRSTTYRPKPGHALNIFFNKGFEIIFYEPQISQTTNAYANDKITYIY